MDYIRRIVIVRQDEIRVAIWPFLKLFERNKMVWPFGLFWTNLSKFETFYEILNFNLVILTIF